MAGPTWASKVLGAVVMTTFVLLLVQLATGAYTDATGPATFTTSTMFPALTAHYGVGVLLGLLALVAFIVTVLMREVRLIVPAVLALVFIGAAAAAGELFIRTAGNPDSYSTGMAIAFALAFIAEIALAHGWTVKRREAAAAAAAAPPTAPTTA